MLDALEQCGVPYDYIEFSNSGHGLLGDPKESREYHKKMLEYADAYFKENN